MDMSMLDAVRSDKPKTDSEYMPQSAASVLPTDSQLTFAGKNCLVKQLKKTTLCLI
jgi:hypothetical protein